MVGQLILYKHSIEQLVLDEETKLRGLRNFFAELNIKLVCMYLMKNKKNVISLK